MRPAQVPHMGFPEAPNSLKDGNCISITNPIHSQNVTITLTMAKQRMEGKNGRELIGAREGMPLRNCLQGNHLLKMGVRKSVDCLCEFTTGLSKVVSFYVFTVSLPD
jgi:hypothetical protein